MSSNIIEINHEMNGNLFHTSFNSHGIKIILINKSQFFMTGIIPSILESIKDSQNNVEKVPFELFKNKLLNHLNGNLDPYFNFEYVIPTNNNGGLTIIMYVKSTTKQDKPADIFKICVPKRATSNYESLKEYTSASLDHRIEYTNKLFDSQNAKIQKQEIKIQEQDAKITALNDTVNLLKQMVNDLVKANQK